jgi:hypothetical protein
LRDSERWKLFFQPLENAPGGRVPPFLFRVLWRPFAVKEMKLEAQRIFYNRYGEPFLSVTIFGYKNYLSLRFREKVTERVSPPKSLFSGFQPLGINLSTPRNFEPSLWLY